MGKLFDALCFFLVLLAAAPHFSRGCGRVVRPDGSHLLCTTVMACVSSNENEHGNSTVVELIGNCYFDVANWHTVSGKDITVKPMEGLLTLWIDGNSTISVRSISFINLRFDGKKSTLSISSSGSSSTFQGCVFVPGATLLFKSLVKVVVRQTHFNLDARGSTMLEIERGSLDISGSHNIVRCSKRCDHTTIKVNICGDTTIKDVELDRREGGSRAIFEFSPCRQAVEKVPNLNIEGITFYNGGRDNRMTPAWMIVKGDDVKGPMVFLRENNYDGLANAHEGNVFQFIGSVPLKRSESKFSLSKYSTRSAPSEWGDDKDLATIRCYFDSDIRGETTSQYYEHKLLPIGRSNAVPLHGLCASYCCYSQVSGVSGDKFFKTDIAACIKNAMEQDGSVRVVYDCPFGEPELPIPSVGIVKADTFDEDRVTITFQEGDYSFVNDNRDGMYQNTYNYENQYKHDPLVFENIHFKSSSGVVNILLGREVATRDEKSARVKMIGCVVDTDVVVKLRKDVNFTATNTTFNQGSKESVLSFDDVETLSATIVECRFDNEECMHEMITGYSCGNVVIESTMLVTGEACNKAAINLSTCASNDGNKATTVKLEKLHFSGEIQNIDDNVAWISVQGNRNGPVVTLKDNNYSTIDSSNWKRPRVYQFRLSLPLAQRHTARMRFSVTREAQTEPKLRNGWAEDQKLAVVEYVDSDGEVYDVETIFPIGNGTLKEPQKFPAHSISLLR